VPGCWNWYINVSFPLQHCGISFVVSIIVFSLVCLLFWKQCWISGQDGLFEPFGCQSVNYSFVPLKRAVLPHTFPIGVDQTPLYPCFMCFEHLPCHLLLYTIPERYMLLHWRWRHHVPLRCRFLPMRPHDSHVPEYRSPENLWDNKESSLHKFKIQNSNVILIFWFQVFVQCISIWHTFLYSILSTRREKLCSYFLCFFLCTVIWEYYIFVVDKRLFLLK
jgi:hypothetical protein